MMLPVTYTNELNDKKYEIGDIVHFVDPYTHTCDWGVVEEHYSNGYGLGLYELVDMRTVNGIPIKEYPFEQKRSKLPKGWTYTTSLVNIGTEKAYYEMFSKYKTITPHDYWSNDTLKQMISDGVMVKPSTQVKSAFPVTDITKDGWTIKLDTHQPSRTDYACVMSKYCYPTYEAAEAEIEAYEDELHRQAELSDYDWSVEQIDKTLNNAHWLDAEYKSHVREWLLEQKDVEEIVTRGTSNGVEWKYDRNKKWMLVV